ncbi:MAG TPA: helicase-related protein, partial [Gemmatimonadaceae bacterium]|nr:helicase-related protein [Gemmatimonadaceae bacterium]
TPAPQGLAAGAASQRSALEAMLPLLDGAADRQRAAILRRLARWSPAPIVAFTQFSATAQAFFRLLHLETGIAMLTGDQARIASGVIPREEVVERLLMPTRSRHDAVRLLITTDVLSEGLSLSGVATVVHLDLPWTVARLDQRVGRAARIGASPAEVRVMRLVAPLPDAVQHALAELLARKRKAMRRFVHDGEVDAACVSIIRSLAGRQQRLGRRRGWLTVRSSAVPGRVLIALVRIDGRRTLVACDADGPRAVRVGDWQALSACTRVPHHPGNIVALRAALLRWRGDRALRLRVSEAGDARLLVRRRTDDALLRGNRVARAQAAQLVSADRRGVMLVTSPAALARLSAQQSAMSGRDGRVDAVQADVAVRTRRRGVRVLCGVAVLPGAS